MHEIREEWYTKNRPDAMLFLKKENKKIHTIVKKITDKKILNSFLDWYMMKKAEEGKLWIMCLEVLLLEKLVNWLTHWEERKIAEAKKRSAFPYIESL